MSDSEKPEICCCCFIILFCLGYYFLSNGSEKNYTRREYKYDTPCIRRDCELSDWSQWSTCLNPCEGNTYRSRYVIREAKCGGTCRELTQHKSCDHFCNYETMYNSKCSCPPGFSGRCCTCNIQNCITEWSDWSTCSKTCGSGGTKTRSRKIKERPQCGGPYQCPPSHLQLSEEIPCNRFCINGEILNSQGRRSCKCQSGFTGECCECKVQDCTMTKWSDWSNCSKSCGPFGTKTRSRNIKKGPQCGGSHCPSSSEEIPCNRFCQNGGSLNSEDKPTSCNCQSGFTGECCECKVQNCTMTEWSDWSVCRPVSGARGKQSRTRTIDTPRQCNGTACSTQRREERKCQLCKNNGTLQPSQNWCRCPYGFSGQLCECKDIDCVLSQWSSWSPCENAVQTRSRHVITNTSCAGKNCGKLNDERTCESNTDNDNQSSHFKYFVIVIVIIVCLVVYRRYICNEEVIEGNIMKIKTC
ncbi:spondin-1-like [Anneissia japonica]|uniref:spondin-1-like n=1 Tax=Anneissia japonica TaxID=1529436 RepID=UPI00142594F8|nr:spondin-1-like [Anneissia japonica]